MMEAEKRKEQQRQTEAEKRKERQRHYGGRNICFLRSNMIWWFLKPSRGTGGWGAATTLCWMKDIIVEKATTSWWGQTCNPEMIETEAP